MDPRTLVALFCLIFLSTSCGADPTPLSVPFSVTAPPLTKPVKVAILDTGLDLTDPRFSSVVCKEGHATFVGESLKDENGHGTHIAGLIKQYAGEGDYCLLIYKYYSPANSGSLNLRNLIKSIEAAVEAGARVINYSGGGPEFSEDEYLAIKKAEAAGVLFIAAAGNEGQNIDLVRNYYYPASYNLTNIVVVGNINDNGKRFKSSNYGKKVTAWEKGVTVLSTLPPSECRGFESFLRGEWQNGCMGYMTGTSQSTAIHTGKIVKEMLYVAN